MASFDQKVDALLRLFIAETDDEREKAKAEIDSLLNDRVKPVSSIERECRRLLLEIGIPECLAGHKYIIDAVSILVADPTVINNITTKLYPGIAEAYPGVTDRRIERTIRHAVEVAWDRGDLDVLQKLFGNTISPNKGKPCNSEFLARITSEVRFRIEEK